MTDINYATSVFRLFKAFPQDTINANNNIDNLVNIKERGYYITPNAVKTVSNIESLITAVYENVNIPIQALNNTFHSSFQKVKTEDIDTLIYQQILHYMTTYGAESFGAYNQDSVYIPFDGIKEFDDSDRIFIHIINSISKEEIAKNVLNLIYSGVALSGKTIQDINTILEHDNVPIDIDNVKNKEYKVYLCVKYGMIPSNPIEFLRVLNYITTKSAMLIKSKSNIQMIRMFMIDSNIRKHVLMYFNKYKVQYGLDKLASIFLRYKPLFLAYKTSDTARIINKIRKLAITHHKPMKRKLLDVLTTDTNIDINELKSELNKVTLFKKVSLMNALLLREDKSNTSFVYIIRNGGVYAKDKESVSTPSMMIRHCVLSSIIDEVSTKVNGKKIYIQPNMDFAFPTSEKNFISGIPFGSVYTLPKEENKSVICGIHWQNIIDGDKEMRVDLDLHASSMTDSIGWDSQYRSDCCDVMFSGDMTDAPRNKGGASELMYFDSSVKDVEYLFTLNYYNHYDYSNSDECEVDCSLVLGYTDSINDSNAIVQAGNLCVHLPLTIHKPNNMIGFLQKHDDDCQFTFMNLKYGDDITYSEQEHKETMLNYFHTQTKTQLRLKDVLLLSGAEIVEDKDNADFVLDLQTMGETDILNMFI